MLSIRLVAKRFADTGGDALATIARKQRPGPPVLSPVTGEVEARLIALALGHTGHIAEIELSALTRQCLDRRISDLDVLNTELTARQRATDNTQRQVDWQFTTDHARIKLRHLYPKN